LNCIGLIQSDIMFRFTIRELILLTVIVAMGAAWWVEHRTLWHKWIRAELRLDLESERAARSGPVTKATLDRALKSAGPMSQ
jgi:hypothetical protein